MKRKLKECKHCKKDKYLFSKGLCLECWRLLNKDKLKIKSNKKPNPISDMQKERLKIYNGLRLDLLKKYPICQVCNINPSTECHHKQKRAGENLFKHLLAVCRDCHIKIENSPQFAYENKFSIPINTKDEEN